MAIREEQILEQLVNRGLGVSGLAGRAVQQAALPTLRQALGTARQTRAQQEQGRLAQFRSRVGRQRAGVQTGAVGTAGGQAPQLTLTSLANLSSLGRTSGGDFTFDIGGPAVGAFGSTRPTTLRGLAKEIPRILKPGTPITIAGVGGGPAFEGLRQSVRSLLPGFPITFTPTVSKQPRGTGGLRFGGGGRRGSSLEEIRAQEQTRAIDRSQFGSAQTESQNLLRQIVELQRLGGVRAPGISELEKRRKPFSSTISSLRGTF